MNTIIIILGLPGSGKTTYAKTITTHKLYDDVLFNQYSKELLDDINNINSINIILTDPRFCDIDIFFKFLHKIGHITDNLQNHLELIVFSNDLNQVRINLEQSETHHKISELELMDFHHKYTKLLDSIEFKYTCKKLKTRYMNVYAS